MTSEMLAATSSYSAKSLNPFALAIVSSSASMAGSGLSVVWLCIFSLIFAMLGCAPMKPLIWASVSLICLMISGPGSSARATEPKNTAASASIAPISHGLIPAVINACRIRGTPCQISGRNDK